LYYSSIGLTVVKVIGFNGEVKFDGTKLDGAPRKLMNADRLKSLAWEYTVSLEQSLTLTYLWFVDNQNKFRS
jgi:GDP-L-fucose synthase